MTPLNEGINDRKFTSFRWDNEKKSHSKAIFTRCFQYQGQRNDIQVIVNCLLEKHFLPLRVFLLWVDFVITYFHLKISNNIHTYNLYNIQDLDEKHAQLEICTKNVFQLDLMIFVHDQNHDMNDKISIIDCSIECRMIQWWIMKLYDWTIYWIDFQNLNIKTAITATTIHNLVIDFSFPIYVVTSQAQGHFSYVPTMRKWKRITNFSKNLKNSHDWLNLLPHMYVLKETQNLIAEDLNVAVFIQNDEIRYQRLKFLEIPEIISQCKQTDKYCTFFWKKSTKISSWAIFTAAAKSGTLWNESFLMLHIILLEHQRKIEKNVSHQKSLCW